MDADDKLLQDRLRYRALCLRFGETPWMIEDPYSPGTFVEHCYSAHWNAVIMMGECGTREFSPRIHLSKTGSKIYGVLLGPGAQIGFTDMEESPTGKWIPCNRARIGKIIAEDEASRYVWPHELSTHYLQMFSGPKWEGR